MPIAAKRSKRQAQIRCAASCHSMAAATAPATRSPAAPAAAHRQAAAKAGRRAAAAAAPRALRARGRRQSAAGAARGVRPPAAAPPTSKQHRGELGRGHAVVHHQPGLVDAGGEGLQAEVASRRRSRPASPSAPAPRPRRSRAAPAATPPRSTRRRSAGAEQARRFHQLHAALAQRSARQQIDIGVQAQHEQERRAPQAAHVGPQRAVAHRELRAARSAAGR